MDFDFKDMDTAQLEARKAELGAVTNDNSLEELEAVAEELRAINAELKARRDAEAERRAAAAAIIEGAGEIVTAAPETIRKDTDKMEIRNTPEYINAFAQYVRTGDDRECRSLLTENVTGGTVAVPEFVLDIVKNAWERNEIINRINKTSFKGNLKVNFEVTAGAATKHTEGGTAVPEETLTLGIVNLIPANYKKWIGVSDEVLDMRGEAFLRYVYDELSTKIIKAICDDLVNAIEAAPSSGPAITLVSGATALNSVLMGRSYISDEADGDAVVILNRTTWAAIEGARLSAGYAVDPFYGLPVIMNSAVDANKVIVGSLSRGAILNTPDGFDVKINVDDKTLATQDMNRIIGRLYAAVGVVAPNAFAVVTIGTAGGENS